MDASVLFHGESYGWETQLLDGGDLVYGRRFPLKAGAIAEADALRGDLLKDGWTLAGHQPFC